MKLYKIGKIVSIGKTYIVLESNYSGTIIYVARPNEFKKDVVKKVFVYEHKSDYSETTYGFFTFKERVLFENLMKVAGVGPKTAMGLLSEGTDTLIDIIMNDNIEALKNYPTIGAKTAAQIMLELSETYKNAKTKSEGKVSPNKISESLKVLGFSKDQITFAVSKVTPQKSIEPMIEEAIKLISNAQRQQT